MEQLVIQRSKWHRGQGASGSALLIPETGKMCCLGFYCLQLGFTSTEISGIEMPHDIHVENITKLKWLIDTNLKSSYDAHELAFINDKTISEQEREQRIAEIFARHDVQVTFVD